MAQNKKAELAALATRKIAGTGLLPEALRNGLAPACDEMDAAA